MRKGLEGLPESLIAKVQARERLAAAAMGSVARCDLAGDGSVDTKLQRKGRVLAALPKQTTLCEVEALARSVDDTDGVYLVPAFAGLGAPHWDPYARGTIVGLTRGTVAGHIARAALEGIAFQVADVLEAMEKDAGIEVKELRVDGGAARNDLLMQIQSDLLQAPTVRPAVTETTALGAAYLAGLAVGFWADGDEISAQWAVDRHFEPEMAAAAAARLRAGWNRALDRAGGWAEEGA